MKTIARALITTIIIASIAIVAGDQKARINLALQSAFEGTSSVQEDAGSYQLDKSWNTDKNQGPLRKVASRKKTAARSV